MGLYLWIKFCIVFRGRFPNIKVLLFHPHLLGVLEGREVETAVTTTIVGQEIVPLLVPVVEMLGVETEAIITVIVMMMKCR